MRHSPVMVVCRVDRYWRGDGSLCPEFDLAISAIPPNIRTIMAPMITIKSQRAYNIVLVLGGWPGDTPWPWWFAESTNIGGTRAHYVWILTWWFLQFHSIIPSLRLLRFQSKSGTHIILFWFRVDGPCTFPGSGGFLSRPILAEWRVIMALLGLGDRSNSTSQCHHNGHYHCNQSPAST
jgi:hypothetical protein